MKSESSFKEKMLKMQAQLLWNQNLYKIEMSIGDLHQGVEWKNFAIKIDTLPNAFPGTWDWRFLI